MDVAGWQDKGSDERQPQHQHPDQGQRPDRPHRGHQAVDRGRRHRRVAERQYDDQRLAGSSRSTRRCACSTSAASCVHAISREPTRSPTRRSPRRAWPMAVAEICLTCSSLDGDIGSMTPWHRSEMAPSGGVTRAGGVMRLIAAIVVLTLVAIGAGALAGLHLFAAAERVADAKKAATPPPSCLELRRQRAAQEAVSDRDQPRRAGQQLGPGRSLHGDRQHERRGCRHPGRPISARTSSPICGRLRSRSSRARAGSSICATTLSERASIRSSGKVRELIIETLVIQ